MLTTAAFTSAEQMSTVLLEGLDIELELSSKLECASVARANPDPQGSEDNLDLNDVQRSATAWKRNYKLHLDGHFTNQVLWCRVLLVNKSQNHFRWFLVLDNTRLNFVNFYMQQSDSGETTTQQHLAGDHRPSMPGQSTASMASSLPTFEFVLPPAEKARLFFAIDTDSVTWLRPKLYSSETYGVMLTTRQLWQWSFAAILLASILLQLSLTRSSVGSTEAYYFLTMSWALVYFYFYFGDANIWLGLDSGNTKNNMLYAANLGYQFFGLCFVRGYLRLNEFFPRLGRIFLLQKLVVVVSGALIFYGFELNQDRVLLAATSTLLTGVLVLVAIFEAIRGGLTWAWGLAITWSTIALSWVLMGLTFLEVIPFFSYTNQLLLWVFPLDVFVLTASFIYQHQRYRTELGRLGHLIDRQAAVKLPKNSDLSIADEPQNGITTTPVSNAESSKPEGEIENQGVPEKDTLPSRPTSKISNTEKRLQGVDCEHKIELLMGYIEREKVHCREDISLNHISGMIGLRADQVSALLNHKLGTSFSTFINEYRVREAKNLLVKSPDVSLIDIAFLSGFNSRSSFNRVFKMHTEVTPAEFRKRSKACIES